MAETDLREELLEEAEEEEEHRDIDREVNYKRIKRWVIQQSGKDYIQYAGLLDLLHQESGGDFTITTKLEQAPSEANGSTAIVSAIAAMGENGARLASGLGDANPGNVSRAMAPHLIRMAETRAKGRALRDLLNIPMVTAEEMGPEFSGQGNPPRAGGYQRAADTPLNEVGPEGIVVEGKRWTREQVWGFYQQRLSQAKEQGVSLPTSLLVNKDAPLSQIVGVTQNIKSRLAPAAAAPEKAN